MFVKFYLDQSNKKIPCFELSNVIVVKKSLTPPKNEKQLIV
jgi:hypothetical protein